MILDKKAIVYGMLFMLFACTVLLLLKASSQGILRENSLKQTVRTLDTIQVKEIPLDRLGEFYDLVRLEARTRRVLQKDILTRKDSIFLDEVNKKLNRILHEKD